MRFILCYLYIYNANCYRSKVYEDPSHSQGLGSGGHWFDIQFAVPLSHQFPYEYTQLGSAVQVQRERFAFLSFGSYSKTGRSNIRVCFWFISTVLILTMGTNKVKHPMETTTTESNSICRSALIILAKLI